MKVEIVPATDRHFADVAADLRPDEREQIWSAWRFTPEVAGENCRALSPDALAAVVDGETMAVFGIAPLSPLLGIGVPWIATTAVVERHPKTFYRLSRQFLERFRARWPHLIGAISARHTRSLAWARHLGFKVLDAVPYGPDGAPFHRVELRG